MKFEDFLINKKLFIFAGNGGTGKTTLSAAWAQELAQRGYNVGLITIDPSRRLGEVFSMDIAKDDFRQIKFANSSLEVHLIQSQKIIENFVVKNFPGKTLADFSQNKLFKQVTTLLAENQSISTVYYLANLIDSKKYDYVVVDTPPANHAADFFRSPEGTLKIFKENILAKKLFESSTVKGWSSKKLFLGVLSFLVGSAFVKEMEDFFQSIIAFQQHIVLSAEKLKSQLSGADVCYFLVTLPEVEKIQEVDAVMGQLQSQGLKVHSWIVNRAYPDWLDLKAPALVFPPVHSALQNYYDKTRNFYDNQNQDLKGWVEKNSQATPIYFVPEKSFFMKDFNLQQIQKSLIEALL